MAQQGQTPAVDAAAAAAGKDKKSSEPLFGPSIGSVVNGPAWTLSHEKKVVSDELTPDIVSSWIEKSKEDDTTDQHHHGLEFEYDCDAPKCGIYVHVYLPKTHPDAPATAENSVLAKLLVFETVVEGGFGNHLKLEEGALLELGRFEHPNGHPDGHTAGTLDSSAELPAVAEASSSGDLAGAHAADAATPGAARNANAQRRRFTHFNFRRRTHNHSISGPALAVVDADPVAPLEGKTKDAKADADEGVKVTIRLAALDEQGTELASPNEQITYLDIVRFGHKEAVVDGAEPAEDTRPWVVKVVKREATIGPHTFHLHEIFGLTSSSTHPAPPTAPPPLAAHTYPPEEGAAQPPAVAQVDDDEPQSECLLCLSSPREVVLLPCRHLVACKDCALNMVEFGAGGNITQATEAVAGAAGDEAVPAAGTPGAAAVPPTPTTAQRRKRKAKGWFCPVCRQPYTSMLRLTTVPPALPESKEGDGSGTEDEGAPAVPEPAQLPAAAGEMRSTGLLGGRPGFLRGLSSLTRAPPADVENQNVAARA